MKKLSVRDERRLRGVVQSIAASLVVMQRSLADVGLYATMHAVNEASKKLGYEAAEKIQGGR